MILQQPQNTELPNSLARLDELLASIEKSLASRSPGHLETTCEIIATLNVRHSRIVAALVSTLEFLEERSLARAPVGVSKCIVIQACLAQGDIGAELLPKLLQLPDWWRTYRDSHAHLARTFHSLGLTAIDPLVGRLEQISSESNFTHPLEASTICSECVRIPWLGVQELQRVLRRVLPTASDSFKRSIAQFLASDSFIVCSESPDLMEKVATLAHEK